MTITAISRDWGTSPSIVRITTTDILSVITAPGYFTSQASAIQQLQNGNFEWALGDMVACTYGDGEGVFNYDPDNNCLVNTSTDSNYLSTTLTPAQFFGMYAAPILIVPAPGTGLMNVVDKFALVLKYNSAAYAAGGAISLEYSNTAAAAGPLATGTIAAANMQGTASVANSAVGALAAVPLATANAAALYLSNATAAFTTGNSPIIVKVWYRVVSTTF